MATGKLKKTSGFIFREGDGGGRFFRNICIDLPESIKSQTAAVYE
jgi:hypothetical protein